MLLSGAMAETSPINLETPIVSLHRFDIPGLGQTSARNLAIALASLNDKTDGSMATVEDFLNYLPARYEDRSNLARISDLRHGMEASLELFVRVAGGFQVGKNRSPRKPKLFIFEISASDPGRTGRPVVVSWFVSGAAAQRIIAYHTKRFSRGARFVAFGRWEWDSRRNSYSLRINKPDELEMMPAKDDPGDDDAHTRSGIDSKGVGPAPVSTRRAGADSLADEASEHEDEGSSDPQLAAIHVGRRVPVYRKLGDFRSKRLREISHGILGLIRDEAITETLPPELRSRLDLISRSDAVRRVHFPIDDAPLADYQRAASPAHQRLIFEEFFWVALALALQRSERVKEKKGALIEITDSVRRRLASVLPFRLTTAQQRVVAEIFHDMQSDSPMNRLLQGDVGSGKTIVAVLAMLAAMENGYQTALMVPTEILAEQHARNIKRLLAEIPYRVELLTGSLRAAQKRRLHEDLLKGEIHACIGTHALIQEAVAFDKLGLVVIDEQHRFGVLQRAELRARGLNPDVLVMTATPIPRSLAMTAYGDLDVSVIDELPPGRTPVKTTVYTNDRRQEVKRLITRELRARRQVYIVYPLVEESEKMDLRDATQRYEYLRDTVFPKMNVGLVHGRMKSEEKDEVMHRFVAGEINILVTTTVIEVGVDVPNASLMIVEHAERFGLSQLHQLRGRVGRGAELSECVLLTSDQQTEVASERLNIMEETSDGFRIAEKDLEIRGPGEVLGTRQSGLPTFRVANLVRDFGLLEAARKEAEYYLNQRRNKSDTVRLIKRVRSDARFGLAAVG
ncbi:MAG: ATP-dependent helicase RecG [Acidobacteriota bacterium]|jgi:ATP-dependent DNA helicase RecG|nr:ATP-dependent helicase RecG [Acidobacteriota bacterium]